MSIALLAIVVAVLALAVAALERRGGRGVELAFRAHLVRELHAARIRNAQLELMLDGKRSIDLELPSPQDRDGHLLMSAPALQAPGTATSTAAPRGALSIDTLPEPLRSEIRALEGDDVQREYLETVQTELANGADPLELHSRLFGD